MKFRELKSEIKDEEFWEKIEKVVKKRTEGFMKVIPYRKLDKEERMKLIDKGFELIYYERENREFF